ncbi:E3 CR1-alpha1 [simian adenovirus 1]|uniref:E3 CR1-alpha1 n=1 Tax=simian adenovirus 1 TaxID=310540 RepID=Q5C8P1_9ADEN|nr:E3 CR1-alpha1 [Simian adenovirus 1]AAX19416.1 E3 CR1-alpha1 [Simian adenovirus 1]
MKICVVIFALSLIKTELFAAPSTPSVISTTKSSSGKGTQTVFYSNSTSSIVLNCACTNELIQWIANGSVCKYFWGNDIVSRNNSLCEHCNSSTLILYPPFVTGWYMCVGSGLNPSCFHKWFLQKETLPNNSVSFFALSYCCSPSGYSFKPLIGILALILIIFINFIIINNLQ